MLKTDYFWLKRKDLIEKLKKESKLFHSPIHGLKHWKTVEKNGLYLSQFNDGDPKVISCFAYFHDSMRVNEYIDNGHGLRDAKYALSNKDRLDLTEDQLQILYRACAEHTGGTHPSCETIACCWDADRLDIRRVGIEPDLQGFNTDSARDMVRAKDYSLID